MSKQYWVKFRVVNNWMFSNERAKPFTDINEAHRYKEAREKINTNNSYIFIVVDDPEAQPPIPQK